MPKELITVWDTCPDCSGTGKSANDWVSPCPACHGNCQRLVQKWADVTGSTSRTRSGGRDGFGVRALIVFLGLVGGIVWLFREAVPQAPDPLPVANLHEARERPLGMPVADILCVKGATDGTAEICAELIAAFDRGIRYQTCSYGPVDADGTGFIQFAFWLHEVPADLAMLRQPDGRPVFRLPPGGAVDGCPADSLSAAALAEKLQR